MVKKKIAFIGKSPGRRKMKKTKEQEDISYFIRHTAKKLDEILAYEISPFDKLILIKYYLDDWRSK